MPDRPSPRPAATRRIPLAIGAVLIGAVIGFAGVYGIGGLKRDAAGDSACRPAVDLARKLAPLAHGEVAALTMATVPLRLRTSLSEDTDGKPKKLLRLARANRAGELWATWCVPCRKEMPALESLQTRLGGADFEVVAIKHRHPRSRKAEELPQGRQSDPAWLFQRSESQGFFKILKLSDGQWGCRPRCWSMVKAARSPPSPDPRNGPVTTPSS